MANPSKRDSAARKVAAVARSIVTYQIGLSGFMKGKIEIKGDIVSPAFTPEEWGEP